MTMLEDLCSGKLQSQNIVIEDSTEAPGRALFMVLLHNMCQRYDEVILLAYERSPHFFINILPESLRDRVRVPDLPKCELGVRHPVGPIIAATRSAIQGEGSTVGVVIDTVSDIVFSHASPTVVPQLVSSMLHYRERGCTVAQVVSVIHTGVHEEGIRRLLRGQPDTLIQLYPPSSPQPCRYACRIRHGEAWEHTPFQTEEFSVSKDCLHLHDVTSQSNTDAVQAQTAQPQVDPTANLTFNLSLKPEERAAKDQVVLPYTQISTENQSGTIHYIPDDDDDFDDEDPDDDLDF